MRSHFVTSQLDIPKWNINTINVYQKINYIQITDLKSAKNLHKIAYSPKSPTYR